MASSYRYLQPVVEPETTHPGTLIAGIVAIAVGGMGLASWAFGVPQRLASTHVITMKTNMALALVLSGTALLLLRRPGLGIWRRGTGLIASAVVFLIGSLTFYEHLFHRNLGIDQLLFKEPLGAAVVLSPNRMGPPGAICLTLIGIGLSALSLRKRGLTPYVGLLVCVISLVPGIGYLYGATPFYGNPYFTVIAWPTIPALVALGVGLVMACVETGPMSMLLRRDAGGALLRHLLPTTLLIPLVLGFISRGEAAGFYGPATSTALLVVCLIVTFAVLLWISAARVSALSAAQIAGHEALRLSEERFRSIFDRAGVGIVEVDANDHFIAANDRACEILGYDSDVLLAMSVRELTFPEDSLRSDELNAQLHEGRFERFTNEKRYLRSDGTPIWVQVTVSAVRDRAGKFLGAITTIENIDERKKAEERIAHLASFPQFNPNPILETDMTGNITYANPALTERFPDTAEAGRHPLLKDWPWILATFNGGGAVSIAREVNVEGSVFHQTVHNLSTQRLLRFYSVDITERKRAEAEVTSAKERAEQTAEQLRTVIDNMAERVYVCDKAGQPLLVNEAFRAFYADGVAPVYPKSFTEHIEVFDLSGQPVPVEDWPLGRAFRGERVRGFELRVRSRKSGQEFVNIYNAAPVHDSHGNIIMAVLTADDITEQKRAEESLRRSEQRLRRFYESGMVGVFYWKADGSITDANDNFLAMTGYTRSDLIAGELDWSRMTPPEYRKLDEEYIIQVKATGIHPPREKEYIRKDGTRISIIVGAASTGDDASDGIAFVIDITDRKRAEQALVRSEKLASAGRMAATVAHEINNPLATLTNLLYLLRKEVTSESGRERLAAAEAQLAQVGHVTRQTLGFYRESSKPTRIQLSQLFEEVLASYSKKLQERKIAVSRDYESAGEVEGLRGELQQVFLNLVVNAMDAMPEGGNLNVRIRREGHQQGQAVRIDVRDTGMGIHSRDQAQIFEPFFTTKQDVGTGLGLWVVKEIVKRHGGVVEVSSSTEAESHGTCFSLCLPEKWEFRLV